MPGKCKQHSKKYLSALSIIVCLSSFSLTPISAYAEVLQMPESPKDFSVTLPGRGMSMTEVLENFGKPLSKDAEVGEPPITRWNYPNYKVIFEYQYVIHSLTIKKPMGLMQPQSNLEDSSTTTNIPEAGSMNSSDTNAAETNQ